MMKQLQGRTIGGIAATIVFAIALCFALAGCSSSSSGGKEFVGDWTMESMTSSGTTMTGDDLKTLGMEVTMTFKEDKTFSLTIMGESLDGKWESSATNKAKLTYNDSSGNYAGDVTIENGKLMMKDGEDQMVFTKKS